MSEEEFFSQRPNFYSQPTPEEEQQFKEHVEFGLQADWADIDSTRILAPPTSENEDKESAKTTTNTDASPQLEPTRDDQVEKRRSESYASFGKDGITATVNAHGRILQISRYFGCGRSGFFCVDLRRTPEPYFVEWRADTLFSRITDPEVGLGLSATYQEQVTPQHDFVDDHWPRYNFKIENLSVDLRYSIKDDMIVQNYSITGLSDDLSEQGDSEKTSAENEASPETLDETRDDSGRSVLSVDLEGLLIRDLEWLDISNGFNENWFNESYPNYRYAGHTENSDSPDYETFVGPNQSSIIVVHHFRKDSEEYRAGIEGPTPPQAVGLVVSLFLNGKAQKVDGTGWSVPQSFRKGQNSTITIVYRLQLMTYEANGWRSALVPASRVFGSNFYPDPYNQPTRLSSDDRLDFIFRRNLENIMSVCAIQTNIKWGWDQDLSIFKRLSENAHGGDVVALTCGDFSGHHIISSASFFAFRILLGISEFLGRGGCESQPKDNQDASTPQTNSATTTRNAEENKNLSHKELRLRILKTCKSHLQWVYKIAWKATEPSIGENNWASGDRIKIREWYSELPVPEALSNTPFQIIKAFEYAKHCLDFPLADTIQQEQSERCQDAPAPANAEDSRPKNRYLENLAFLKTVISSIECEGNTNIEEAYLVPEPKFFPDCGRLMAPKSRFDHFARAVQRWINDLTRKNRRGQFAFHRSDVNGIGTFRLGDHVWIWTALRCIEEMGLSSRSDDVENTYFLGRQVRPLTSKEAQKNMLQRFTVEDSSIKRRMIANSRSVLENRFLFRCRDTALIYASFSQFFGTERSRLTPWQNTINMQRSYDYNDESRWQKSLRHGLAMLICSNNKWQINEKSPKEMFFRASDTLLSSCGANGIFPGQVDASTGEPGIFNYNDDRDPYWHATFEIPYIFWVLRAKTQKTHEIWDSTKSVSAGLDRPPVSPVSKGPAITIVPPSDIDRIEEFRISNDTNPNQQQSLETELRKAGDQQAVRNFFANKSAPIHHVIDQDSIFEVNDTWLYRYPEFLDFEPAMPSSTPEFVKWLSKKEDGTNREFPYDGFFEDGVAELNKLAPQEPKGPSNSTTKWEDETKKWEDEATAYIINVPKMNTVEGKRRRFQEEDITAWYIRSNEDVLGVLANKRIEQSAKKRLIWLPSPAKDVAIMSMFGSPQEDEVFEFFRRHFGCEKYFFDEVMNLRNSWETELHLSFYQLLKEGTSESSRMSTHASYFRVMGRGLAQGAIGFRFDGDFLDRFWTGYVVENVPNRHDYPRFPPRLLDPFSDKPPKDWTKAWPQRKVLELMILDKILSEISISTDEILDEFEKLSGIRSSDPTFEGDYFSSSDKWNALVHGLTRVEEDLAGNLEILQSWRTREADRGKSRPRWTKGDERKYRSAIDAMVRLNRQKFRRLDALHLRIKNLAIRIESYAARYRDDLSLRSAEDTRIFTNVTVVFLPLGFATGLYSMSGAPAHTLLLQTVQTAIVALFLTILALKYAKANAGLVKDISEFFDAVFRLPANIVRKSKKTSLLYRHYHKQLPKIAESDTQRNKGEEASIEWQMRKLGHGLWHCWHWTSFLMQEIPAQQLTLAYGSLPPIATRGTAISELATASLQITGAWMKLQLSPARKARRMKTTIAALVSLPRANTNSRPPSPTSNGDAASERVPTNDDTDAPSEETPGKNDTESSPDEPSRQKDTESTPENEDNSTKKDLEKTVGIKKAMEATFRATMFLVVVIVGFPIWLILAFKNFILTGLLWTWCKFLFHSFVFILLLPFFIPVSTINLVALNIIDVFRLLRKVDKVPAGKEQETSPNPRPEGNRENVDINEEPQGTDPTTVKKEKTAYETVLEKWLLYPRFARPFKNLDDGFSLGLLMEIFRDPFASIVAAVESQFGRPPFESNDEDEKLDGSLKKRKSHEGDNAV